jgi:sphingomyelin phosphodiesterase acid-like 3
MRKLMVAFFILWIGAVPALAVEKTANFLCLADIHFNPFAACGNQHPCVLILKLRAAPVMQWANLLAQYDTAPPHSRQDTNYTLLTAALAAAKKIAIAQQVKFVLVLGDFLAHDLRENYKFYSGDKTRSGYQVFVYKTLAFLTQQSAATFAQTNVYMAVGNNDSYQGDYLLTPKSVFFADATQLWSTLIQDKTNQAAMRKTAPIAGYYAVAIPNSDNMRLIVLDSTLFSNKARGRDIAAAAETQLTWLHTQLALAQQQHQKVFIAMHIPLSINIGELLPGYALKLVEFWDPHYAALFEQTLNEYATEITGILTGHLHVDWSQVLRFRLNEIPVLGTRSISPIYGGRPGFRVYTYSPITGRISDFVTYYSTLQDIHAWRGMKA